MRRFRMWKVLKVIVLVALALTVFGFVTEHLWNWLMPVIFGLKKISFVQALGLVVLSKILLGGIHKHGPGGGRRGWKRHMEERWAQMTPEERARFKAGMRERGNCDFRGGWRRDEWGPRGPWGGRGERDPRGEKAAEETSGGAGSV